MSEQSGKLYDRIAAVTKAISGMKADKKNVDQGYDYISADQVLDRVGRAMADHGLVIIPSISAEALETVQFINRYGKEATRLDAVIEFDMLVADINGNSESHHWIGRGSDYATPDKALYKAITSGHKYFLMKLFNIGIGNEDGEHEPGDEKARSKRHTPSQPAPEPPSKPENGGNGKKDSGIPQALVDAKIAQNVPNASQILNLMPQSIRSNKAQAVKWGKQYRGFRDQGQEIEDAAESASEIMGLE